MALTTQATYDLKYVSDSHTENVKNISAKTGDELYIYCLSSYASSSGNMTDTPKKIGTITKIEVTLFQNKKVLRIGFNYTSVGLALADIPGSTVYTGGSSCDNMFLSFKKDCNVNISSLAGYYASATFVSSDPNNYGELYSIGAQVGASSK